jgi:pimeloyl-ACP methyl ester carboxylesterase
MFSRLIAVLLLAGVARADGPADNVPEKVRRIPPEGIKVPAEVRAELQKRCDELGKTIDNLRDALKSKPPFLLALLPDVQIFHKAVHDALKYDEFYSPAEFDIARNLLEQGFLRASRLRSGSLDWTRASGYVVRGYVSKIDGSVQPYGLVVPASYEYGRSPHRYRLDFWCHGRGEKLTELAFLDQRMKSPGEFTPRDAFVLHLYGRYCCANKFAGEVDLFEAYDSVRQRYPIDENRLVIRGFSMGGAACWQFAVHYPGMWAAAAPGAGFSETPDFLTVFQKEKLNPKDYEKKLWGLYDCTDYALNLYNCPTVAYSGEDDIQKQAADKMAEKAARWNMTLTHIIGPKTGHGYHPESKIEINRRIDSIVARGRDPVPSHVRFQTRTLRYNHCKWVQIDGLEEHWKNAEILVEISKQGRRDQVVVRLTNVTAFTLDMPPGHCPFDLQVRPTVAFSDRGMRTVIEAPGAETDRSWKVHLRKVDGQWKFVPSAQAEGLAKQHGLQGPIDDAFWDRFLMVRPTGKPLNAKVGDWATTEMKHAVEHWRRQFRGEAPIKDDKDITDADIASSNLILWGDPSSNKVLARIASKLPIRWEAEFIHAGKERHETGQHVALLIYPNPLNPKKYVVLNSGFTFREYDYLNNARQVPKLPDYAIIDVSAPVTSQSPGKVVTAGFFNERWQLP